MLIILEGIDGAGKSTLARRLAELLARTGIVTSIHRGPPTAHPLDEYLTPLLDYRPGTGQHWILDRWHVGERVYPALRGRSTRLDDAVWWYLNAYIRRLGGLVVHCDRGRTGLEETYRERGEERELTEIDQATKLFAEAFDSLLCAQTNYFFDLGDPDVTAELNTNSLIELASHLEKHAELLTRYVTYVGPQKPRYLLLGEVRHGLNRVEQLVTRTDRRPAFVPYRTTSGHWLLEALLGDEELAGGVGLANARDVDDVYALWRDLGKPRTVTLGRQAHREAALYADLYHGQVSHPQHARRFHTKKRAEYCTALLAALETNGDHSRWHESLAAGTVVRFTPKSSTPFAAQVSVATAATAPRTT